MSLIVKFLSLYKFGSNNIALLGHPYALARTEISRILKSLFVSINSEKILDVGCGSMPYRKLFRSYSIYHGLEFKKESEISKTKATHFYDGTFFPFNDETYDVILCSQVLEHSFSPKLLLSEIFRVLEVKGSLYLTIPFLWPEHEQPYDSQRFTSFGLIKILEEVGFRVVSVNKTNPGLSAIIQLLIEWTESISRLFIKGKLMLLAWRLIMFIPYTVLNYIGLIYRNIPLNNSSNYKSQIYLDLVVVATKS